MSKDCRTNIPSDNGGGPTATRRAVIRQIPVGLGALASFAMPLTSWAASGDLTIAIPNNPSTLDPLSQANHDGMVVSQTIFENLLEVDADGRLQPQLAVKLPTISADETEYLFDLRADVKFQNGDQFGAEDVKYSFDWVLNPENKALRRPLFDRISEVIVESPLRVRFRLREPYRPWLYYMNKYMGIFPKGSREKYGAAYFQNSPVGVGTGPGQFVEWKQNDRLVLAKNPNYWRRGAPEWERLVVRVIPDDVSRIAYLSTGQVDIISAPSPKDIGKLKLMKGVEVASRLSLGGLFYLMINTKRPPFDDVNFRRAIANSIDRRALATKIFYGLVEPVSIPAPPGSWWFDKEADTVNGYNLATAQDYLRRSKYAGGVEFDMLVPSPAYLLDVRDAAVVIQAQLAAIGVKLNIREAEQGILLQQTRLGNYSSALQVWMSPGEPTFLIDMVYGKDNVFSKASGYQNESAWDLINNSYRHTSEEKLKPIFSQLLMKLATDSPHVWLGYAHAANAWRSEVKGFKVNQGLTMMVRDVRKS